MHAPIRNALRAGMTIAILAGVSRPLEAQFDAGIAIGSKAPAVTIADLDGKPVDLGTVIGKKPVMIEFWATWCDICKKEMPNLVRLNNSWKDKGFLLISIVLQSGSVDDVRKIMRDKKLNYAVLLDHNLTVATKTYGLAGPIPLKVVIDHKGIIRYAHVGENTMGADDDLPFVIEDLVKELPKK